MRVRCSALGTLQPPYAPLPLSPTPTLDSSPARPYSPRGTCTEVYSTLSSLRQKKATITTSSPSHPPPLFSFRFYQSQIIHFPIPLAITDLITTDADHPARILMFTFFVVYIPHLIVSSFFSLTIVHELGLLTVRYRASFSSHPLSTSYDSYPNSTVCFSCPF